MPSGPHSHSYKVPTATRGSHTHPDLESRLAALEATLTDPDQLPAYADRDYTAKPSDDLAALLKSVETDAVVGVSRGSFLKDFNGIKPGQTLVGELDPQTAGPQFPLGRPLTIFSPPWLGASLRALEGCRIVGIEVSGLAAPDVAIDLDAGTDGWGLLAYIYSHNNSDGGIGFSGDVEVCYFETSNNGRIGIKGRTLGDDDVRDGGYVHHGKSLRNNEAKGFDPAWEAGGSKYLNHNGLIVEDMVYEDNWGPGHWVDHGGTGNVARRIWSKGNLTGLMWEITTGGLIEDCQLVDIASADNTVGAGNLYLSNAADVTVRRCIINGVRSHAAVAVKDDTNRKPTPANLTVEDCTITRRLPGGFSAAVWGFSGTLDSSPKPGFTWQRNKYEVAPSLRATAWGWPSRKDWAAWQAFGFDLDSTLTV